MRFRSPHRFWAGCGRLRLGRRTGMSQPASKGCRSRSPLMLGWSGREEERLLEHLGGRQWPVLCEPFAGQAMLKMMVSETMMYAVAQPTGFFPVRPERWWTIQSWRRGGGSRVHFRMRPRRCRRAAWYFKYYLPPKLPEISRRVVAGMASRRSFARDAKWSSTETGTRKTGMSTSGNWLIEFIGQIIAKANNWKIEGDVRNPVVTAPIRSARPKRFQAKTKSVFLSGARA